jgi:hypothetical protein
VRIAFNLENRAFLSDVDLVAAEHCVSARAKARFLRQLNQQLQSLLRHAILGIVQINAGGIEGKFLATPGTPFK